MLLRTKTDAAKVPGGSRCFSSPAKVSVFVVIILNAQCLQAHLCKKLLVKLLTSNNFYWDNHQQADTRHLHRLMLFIHNAIFYRKWTHSILQIWSPLFTIVSRTKCPKCESNRRSCRHLCCPATKWPLSWRPAVFSWHHVQIVAVLSWLSCQDVRKYTMSHTLIWNIRTRWEPARRSNTYYRTDPVYRFRMSRYMAGSSWKHHQVPQEIGNSNFKKQPDIQDANLIFLFILHTPNSSVKVSPSKFNNVASLRTNTGQQQPRPHQLRGCDVQLQHNFTRVQEETGCLWLKEGGKKRAFKYLFAAPGYKVYLSEFNLQFNAELHTSLTLMHVVKWGLLHFNNGFVFLV